MLADVRAGHEGPDPDRGGPPPAPDQPRADLQRPQRLLPAAVPEQVPEPHRHPGLPQGQRRGQLAREHADLQADDPVPLRPRAGLPGAVRGALPARRGRRGDRDPRQPPLRGRPGPQGDARRGRRPAAAVRAAGRVRPARRGHRLRPGRHGRRVLPAAGGPRGDHLRARPGAGRDAPLRHPAVPPAQGRGPRGRVRVGDPARRQDGLQRRPRPRLHARRPVQPGLRRGRGRHRLLRHEQAGHPRRGRRRGARRPRVPAHGHPGPAVPGPRRQARRRHRRRLHLDGLLADVGPPGRQRGDAGLPPRHEGHAGLERGPRGPRGGRHRDLPGRPGAGRDRRRGQRDRRRVHPDGPRRARRLRPPPPGARARHRVHRPVRPRAPRHRPGPRPHLDRAGLRGPGGHQAAPAQGRRGHVRDRPPRRLRHRRRAHRRGDRGPGHRRGPPLRVCGGRVPQGPRPHVDPEPPDARRAAAGVPLDRAVHRRDQGAALPDGGHGGRGAQPQLHRVRAAVHARGRGRRIDPLPPVHLRGHRVLRPAPPGHRVRHHAPDARAAVPRRARATGA